MYLKIGVSFFVITLLALGVYLGVLQLNGNFHPVIAGELYRAAQPDKFELAEYKRDYNIKTIINLRGENKGKRWYDKEVKNAAKLGITHIDFRMSEKQQFTPNQVAQLIEIYKHAQKPILIHCRSGSDRTGLAAAIYIAKITNQGEDEAEDQLSIYYGHISLPWTSKHKMDFSWEALEPLLGFYDS